MQELIEAYCVPEARAFAPVEVTNELLLAPVYVVVDDVFGDQYRRNHRYGRHYRDQRHKRACHVDTGVDESSRGAVDALLMYLPLRLQHEIAEKVLDQQQGEERDRSRGCLLYTSDAADEL